MVKHVDLLIKDRFVTSIVEPTPTLCDSHPRTPQVKFQQLPKKNPNYYDKKRYKGSLVPTLLSNLQNSNATRAACV